MDEIDYKDLLLRYMAQVINQEGYPFTDFLPSSDTRNVPLFTEQEAQYLINLEAEARKKFTDI